MTADADTKAVVAMLTESLSDKDRLSLALALLTPQSLPDTLPFGTVAIDAVGHGSFENNPRVYLRTRMGWQCSNGACYEHLDLDARILHRRSALVIHMPVTPRKKLIPVEDFDEDDFDLDY